MSGIVNLFGNPLFFEGLYIYPIKMKHYLLFMSVVDVLRIKKNRIADINVIRMSYLNFLFDYLMRNEEIGSEYMRMLLIVFKLSLSKKQYKTIKFEEMSGKYYISYVSYENLEKENPTKDLIDATKFEDLRKFILKLNNIKDVNYQISKETEELLEKAKTERARIDNPNGLTLTIEDMVDCYHVWTGFSYKEIKNEPVFKFIKNVSRTIMIDNYMINKTAEMSGNVKFKKEVEHWLRHIEDSDEYDGVRIPLDKFVQDFNEKVSNK